MKVNARKHGQYRDKIDNLLIACKKMHNLAFEIKGMYRLLDDRHHELTYKTMRMENDFIELFKLVYGCQPEKSQFKLLIDQICGEQEQVEKTLSQSFFKTGCN